MTVWHPSFYCQLFLRGDEGRKISWGFQLQVKWSPCNRKQYLSIMQAGWKRRCRRRIIEMGAWRIQRCLWHLSPTDPLSLLLKNSIYLFGDEKRENLQNPEAKNCVAEEGDCSSVLSFERFLESWFLWHEASAGHSCGYLTTSNSWCQVAIWIFAGFVSPWTWILSQLCYNWWS